jgi:hypothetical protein
VIKDAVIEEINSSGQKTVGYVNMPNGTELAKQDGNAVTWRHYAPAGTGLYETYSNQSFVGRTEFDPLGANIALHAPPGAHAHEGSGDIGDSFGGILDSRWSDFFNLSGGCTIDGVAATCDMAMRLLNSGAAVIGPANTTRWNPNLNNGQGGFQFFRAFADGTQGWGNSLGWVPGSSGHGAGAPPTLKTVSPEEAARRRAIVGEFGTSGWGDEGYELEDSPDYWFPQNSPQTPCEQKLAGIFGGPGAIMRTRYDADGQYRGRNPELAARVAANTAQMGTPVFDAEHLYNFPHLSGNLAGTENTGIYVPAGFDPRSVTGPTKGDAIVTFYYPAVDFTLAIFHVNNFGINTNDRNAAGSIRVGATGGPGGTSADRDPIRPNLHSHFEIWNGRTGYLPPGDARNAARVPFTFVYCP